MVLVLPMLLISRDKKFKHILKIKSAENNQNYSNNNNMQTTGIQNLIMSWSVAGSWHPINYC